MATLTKVQRALAGSIVKADVTGTGLWLTGRIVSFNDKTITFAPADGSEEVTMIRAEVYKATAEELEAAGRSVVVTDSPKAVKAPKEVKTVEATKEAESDDTAEETGTTLRKNGVIASVYLEDYVPTTSANGNASMDNNDHTATRLRMKDLDEVYEIVSQATGESVEELKAKYGHLNNGMQRMTLGNKLRASSK